MTAETSPSVLFVCTGNICRSPTAHALLVHKAREARFAVRVDSAAVSDEERGKAAFIETFDMIEEGVDGLLARLRHLADRGAAG